jgi:hypothetical protein
MSKALITSEFTACNNFLDRHNRLNSFGVPSWRITVAQKLESTEPSKRNPTTSGPAVDEAELVRRILRTLASLEYGSVEIFVQDSKVVQIERTQRSRFSQPLEIPRA